jgi:hypothetical protein
MKAALAVLVFCLASFSATGQTAQCGRHCLSEVTKPDCFKCVRESPPSCTQEVIRIAKQVDASFVSRDRAIYVLGQLNTPETLQVLKSLTTDKEPLLRCLSMYQIAATKKSGAVSILLGKLDDNETCITMTSNHPRSDTPVSVSEEAARLLDLVTGTTPPTSESRLQAVARWKNWWSAQRKNRNNR